MALTTIILFLLILGVIVFFHELGHFFMAKLYGVKVDEFGLGFPPRAFGIQKIKSEKTEKISNEEKIDVEIFDTVKNNGAEIIEEVIIDKVREVDEVRSVEKWRWILGKGDKDEEPRSKKGENEGTIYSLNWIPLGGFVKIEGEDGENKNDTRSFSSRSISERFQILSAGVVMNFFLAFVIFSAIFMLGFPQDITGVESSAIKNAKNIEVKISEVKESSPAFSAGLMAGDTVEKAGDINIESIEDLQNYTKENVGKTVVLAIKRGEKNFTKEIIPREEYPENEGPMGVTLAQTAVISYSPLAAIKQGYEYTVQLTMFIILAFTGIIWSLATTGKTAADISGPVGIAAMTQQAAAMGFMTVLNFTAIISVNLAIINALPFPALDGGRLLFLIVEKIKGSPINQEWEAKANNVGFALLMLLMAVVTFKDLAKFDIFGKVMGLFG